MIFGLTGKSAATYSQLKRSVMLGLLSVGIFLNEKTPFESNLKRLMQEGENFESTLASKLFNFLPNF